MVCSALPQLNLRHPPSSQPLLALLGSCDSAWEPWLFLHAAWSKRDAALPNQGCCLVTVLHILMRNLSRVHFLAICF